VNDPESRLLELFLFIVRINLIKKMPEHILFKSKINSDWQTIYAKKIHQNLASWIAYFGNFIWHL